MCLGADAFVAGLAAFAALWEGSNDGPEAASREETHGWDGDHLRLYTIKSSERGPLASSNACPPDNPPDDGQRDTVPRGFVLPVLARALLARSAAATATLPVSGGALSGLLGGALGGVSWRLRGEAEVLAGGWEAATEACDDPLATWARLAPPAAARSAPRLSRSSHRPLASAAYFGSRVGGAAGQASQATSKAGEPPLTPGAERRLHIEDVTAAFGLAAAETAGAATGGLIDDGEGSGRNSPVGFDQSHWNAAEGAIGTPVRALAHAPVELEGKAKGVAECGAECGAEGGDPPDGDGRGRSNGRSGKKIGGGGGDDDGWSVDSGVSTLGSSIGDVSPGCGEPARLGSFALFPTGGADRGGGERGRAVLPASIGGGGGSGGCGGSGGGGASVASVTSATSLLSLSSLPSVGSMGGVRLVASAGASSAGFGGFLGQGKLPPGVTSAAAASALPWPQDAARNARNVGLGADADAPPRKPYPNRGRAQFAARIARRSALTVLSACS